MSNITTMKYTKHKVNLWSTHLLKKRPKKVPGKYFQEKRVGTLKKFITDPHVISQLCSSSFFFTFLGMTLRPDRPAASPDTTQSRPRIKQIDIPIIFSPPPSSPRQTHTPIKPVQPNTQTVRISSPSQPASPQLPGHSPLPAEPRRPVVETGEAGPPGYMRRVTVRRGSEDSTSEPVKGFAGAPGGFGSKFIILTYTVYWLFLTCDYNLSLCVHGRINICSFRDQKWIWPNPNYKPQITV